jgi:hypothetical protein
VELEEEVKVRQSCDRDEVQNEVNVLIDCNDTIAAVDGVMSHCRVSISTSDGGVGKVKRAEAFRKGHDAISVVLSMRMPDGT